MLRMTTVVWALCFIVGCKGGDSAEFVDANLPPSTTSGSHGTDGDQAWSVEQVEDADVGMQARLAIAADGALAIAYWANQPVAAGPCSIVATMTLNRQDLKLAERAAGATSWTVEKVGSPLQAGQPFGTDVAFGASKEIFVVYMGGEPEDQWCGPNDVVLATRSAAGTWTAETVVSTSGEATSPKGGSNSGHVVGQWPGLATDASGNPAIIYRDIHYGAMQHDDEYRADAEFAWRQGGWSHEMVDDGDGAGEHNMALFDKDGRPVVVYSVPVNAASDNPRKGVWAARRETDGTWTRVALHQGVIGTAIGAAVSPVNGEIAVAFYSEADSATKLVRLADPSGFGDAAKWTPSFLQDGSYVDNVLSVAFAPDGRLGVAYQVCRLLTSSENGCVPTDETLGFAIAAGKSFRFESIEKPGIGKCAEYGSLAFSADGTAHIAFTCSKQVGAKFEQRLYVASKKV